MRIKGQNTQPGKPPGGVQNSLVAQMNAIENPQCQAKVADLFGQPAAMTINSHGQNEVRTSSTVNELSTSLFPQVRRNIEILSVFGNIGLFSVKPPFRHTLEKQFALSTRLSF